MTTNTIVLLLLALTAVGQIAVAASAGMNAELLAEVRYMQRAKSSASLGVVIILVGLATLALWIWYSISVRDWRFAAIAAIPVFAQYLIKAATPARKAS